MCGGEKAMSQKEHRRIKLEALRREIAKGIEQLDRGEGIPGEQVFAELREKGKAQIKRGQSRSWKQIKDDLER